MGQHDKHNKKERKSISVSTLVKKCYPKHPFKYITSHLLQFSSFFCHQKEKRRWKVGFKSSKVEMMVVVVLFWCQKRQKPKVFFCAFFFVCIFPTTVLQMKKVFFIPCFSSCSSGFFSACILSCMYQKTTDNTQKNSIPKCITYFPFSGPSLLLFFS